MAHRYNPLQRRAAKHTDIGGEWIGPRSIAHALVKLVTRAAQPKRGGKAPTTDLLHTGAVPRPRLLAIARRHGVHKPRGAPSADIRASIRRVRAVRVARPAASGSPSLASVTPGGHVRKALPRRPVSARLSAGEQRQVQHFLDHWGELGVMHEADQRELLGAQPERVLDALLRLRGIQNGSVLSGPKPKVIALAREAHLATRMPERPKGDVPAAFLAMMLGARSARPAFLPKSALSYHGVPGVKTQGRIDSLIRRGVSPRKAIAQVRGVPGPKRAPKPPAHVRIGVALDRWVGGSPSGTNDRLFAEFGREDLRKAAKARGVAIKRGATREDILAALKEHARQNVIGARRRASNPGAGVHPGAPIVGGANKYHRDLTDVQHLVDGVESGVAERKMAAQGFVGETWIEKFRNGVRAIHKWSKRDHAGADAKDQADAEQMASLLGRAIGARVPAVFRHNDTEIYMDFVPDAVTASDAGFEVWEPPADVLRSRDAAMLGLLDVMSGNFDRHSDNYMVDTDGHLWGIDHGLAWSPAGLQAMPAHEPPGGGLRGHVGSFDRIFSREKKKAGFRRAAFEWDGSRHGIPLDELRQMRSRIEALQPDFDKLGRRHWHEYALARLDQVIRATERDAGRSDRKAAARAARQAALAVRPVNPRRAIGGRRPRGVRTVSAAVAALSSMNARPDRTGRERIIEDQPARVLRQMLNPGDPSALGFLDRQHLVFRAKGRLGSPLPTPSATPTPVPARVRAGARLGRAIAKRVPVGVTPGMAASAAIKSIASHWGRGTGVTDRQLAVVDDQPVAVLRRMLAGRVPKDQLAKMKRGQLVRLIEGHFVGRFRASNARARAAAKAGKP